jgi:hypothetical protein
MNFLYHINRQHWAFSIEEYYEQEILAVYLNGVNT